jgi:hypothetical protein
MKLYTPEKTELIDVTVVRPQGTGLLIEGKIMGAMPMKAMLRPSELRAGFRLLSFRTLLTLLAMLFRRDP